MDNLKMADLLEEALERVVLLVETKEDILQLKERQEDRVHEAVAEEQPT
jgi:hypothetical protein